MTLLVLSCRPTAAQHVDVLLWDDGGKVGVGEFDFDNLVASERRVHLGRFDDLYSVSNPGFAAQASVGALPGGEALTWDFLPMTVEGGTHSGYRSTLLYWDGEGASPQFGPTPTDEYEFSLYSLVDSAAATGANVVEAGGVITTTPPNGTLHEHPYYFLDDNGDGLNTTLPAPGVYLVSLRLAIGALEPSDPVFFVWATPEPSVAPAIQPAARWVNERLDTLAAEPLPGDFNLDGVVDAADYTVWRDGLSSSYQPSDYGLWLGNYASRPAPSDATHAVPEPAGLLIAIAFASLAVPTRAVLFFGA